MHLYLANPLNPPTITEEYDEMSNIRNPEETYCAYSPNLDRIFLHLFGGHSPSLLFTPQAVIKNRLEKYANDYFKSIIFPVINTPNYYTVSYCDPENYVITIFDTPE